MKLCCPEKVTLFIQFIQSRKQRESIYLYIYLASQPASQPASHEAWLEKKPHTLGTPCS